MGSEVSSVQEEEAGPSQPRLEFDLRPKATGIPDVSKLAVELKKNQTGVRSPVLDALENRSNNHYIKNGSLQALLDNYFGIQNEQGYSREYVNLGWMMGNNKPFREWLAELHDKYPTKTHAEIAEYVHVLLNAFLDCSIVLAAHTVAVKKSIMIDNVHTALDTLNVLYNCHSGDDVLQAASVAWGVGAGFYGPGKFYEDGLKNGRVTNTFWVSSLFFPPALEMISRGQAPHGEEWDGRWKDVWDNYSEATEKFSITKFLLDYMSRVNITDTKIDVARSFNYVTRKFRVFDPLARPRIETPTSVPEIPEERAEHGLYIWSLNPLVSTTVTITERGESTPIPGYLAQMQYKDNVLDLIFLHPDRFPMPVVPDHIRPGHRVEVLDKGNVVKSMLLSYIKLFDVELVIKDEEPHRLPALAQKVEKVEYNPDWFEGGKVPAVEEIRVEFSEPYPWYGETEKANSKDGYDLSGLADALKYVNADRIIRSGEGYAVTISIPAGSPGFRALDAIYKYK